MLCVALLKATAVQISVVVAHYALRGTSNLRRLCEQMTSIRAGCNYDLLIVTNVDTPEPEDEKVGSIDRAMMLRESATKLWPCVSQAIASINNTKGRSGDARLSELLGAQWLTRLNLGMNLGAWDAGWRWHQSGQDQPQGRNHYFLFIQDEVEIRRENWLSGFVDRFEQNRRNARQPHQGPLPIMLGETWNQRWDQPWEVLRSSPLNQPDHDGGGTLGMGRVDFYLSCLRRWSIKAHRTGGHLRALIIFSDQASLNLINGFHLGTHKHSCIASEIALSQAVLALGGKVAQVDESEPFRYLWHREWRKDGLSKLQ